MAKNLLLEYSEELATKCELLCKSISGNSNTVFQLRKSSSSVFANITEAQYPQSLADMLSKFKIALKEFSETRSNADLYSKIPHSLKSSAGFLLHIFHNALVFKELYVKSALNGAVAEGFFDIFAL